MPNKITYTITTSDGKSHQVSEENINKYGMQSYADAYKGATIRMRDKEGADYDIPLGNYDDAQQQGLHPFRFEHTPANDSADTRQEQNPQQGQQSWKPTPMQRMAFNMQAEQFKRDAAQRTRDFNERMDNLQEYGRSFAGGHTASGGLRFNPQSKKMERTYLTPTGERTFNKAAADAVSREYRDAVDMTVGGQMRRAQNRLQELKDKAAARAQELQEKWKQDYENNDAPLAAVLAADTYVPSIQSDQTYRALQAAIRQTEEQIKTLGEQQDRDNGVDVGFWRGFGRVAGDIRTWDFGVGNMLDAMTMMNAAYPKRPQTEQEKAANQEMMRAIHENQQTEAMYGGNASFWNRAGMMTGYMPSFMVDFIATGGGFEGINLATRAAGKAATKMLGKEAVEQMAKQGFKTYVRNNGLRGVGQEAANWTVKALGTTADELLIRAPLMTNTVQGMDTAADIIDRKLGDVTVDENGNYDFSNDKTWGSAVWQGEANSIVENYSEMFGAHLPEFASAKNLGRLADVIGAKRLSGVLSRANSGALGHITDGTRRIFEKMGVSDYLGEVSEEYYGQLWRTMLNLDDAYQQNPDGTRTNLLATGQFHGDIWGGMALSMGLMGAGKTTMSAAGYLSMKHDVNKADARASELLTPDVWEPLRSTIDMATNDNVGDVAEVIVNDNELTNEEKAAVLNYMERSLYLRGANLAELVKSRGGEQDENAQRANDSYMDGYNARSDEEMQDARNMYELQRQKAEQALEPEQLDEIDNDPIGALHSLGGDEATNRTVIDYINAKQVYDGMLQRVRDDIDGRIDQSNAMIDSRVNRTTGMIQGATLKVQDDEGNDRRVYVVDGNLSAYEDGTGIDKSNSDDSIIIRDAETGKIEMVSPDALFSMELPVDPETEKQTAAEAIRQQYAQEAANRIDGTVAFQPGDTYTVTDESGQAAQIQIVPNENGLVDNGDGTVNVSSDGGQTVVPMRKEDIQAMVDATNRARVAQVEQQREAMQQPQAQEQPAYSLNDELALLDENGNEVRGSITADANEDGQYEVYTESPINGRKVNLFTADELNRLNANSAENSLQSGGNFTENDGISTENGNNSTENIPQNGNIEPQNIPAPAETLQADGETLQEPLQGEVGRPSALERIPKDEQGQPVYEQADPETAWDAIVEQAEGDEAMAQSVADSMVADKEAELKKVEKAKPKGGATIAEKIAAERERKNAVEQAKANLALWQKIAQTSQRRRQAAMAEQSRQAAEAARLRREQEEQERAAREEAERIRREALNGVPDFVDDTPQDARARGYRRVNGEKVDRQQSIPTRQGKEVQVKFDDRNIPTGHVALIDASQLQPSHLGGYRNPLHFIDEAQPKERNDDASVMSARRIAAHIRPEEITSSVTAYTGAPTVNTRGEVIQGNNRSAALREMWAAQPEQAAVYKQYLTDHAADFGLAPEDVEAMQQPVLVNMLDVPDEDAIMLGQFVAQDTESGGTERIKPKNIVQKMGDNMRNFAGRLLASPDEEMTFSELVDRNGLDVLKWMQSKGYITPTQYRSAFDSRDNLTAEAKNDLKGIMFQSIFQNGNTHLEGMFNALPAKAQKAILATAYRDYDSPNTERLNAEIQNSISAYYALSQDPAFAGAKNYKEARMAVEAWKRQYALDDVTGESYLPSERYSNFALLLATMYKGQTQTFIQNTFANIYDLVQGTQEETLFDKPDNTPRTLSDAIDEAINNVRADLLINNRFIYDGQQRSNVLVGDSTASQQGGQGSNGSTPSGGRIADTAGTASDNRGTESDSGQEALDQRETEFASRIEVSDDDWQEGDSERPTYKRSIIIDGKHTVTQIDEPDESGHYTGSYFEFDNRRFGDLQEIVDYIDNGNTLSSKIAQAEAETNQNPTDGQKEAGNYKKGHVRIGQFDITVENPKGSVRRGTDASGKAWEQTMRNTYGYIRGTEGVDGDHIDVFLTNDIDGWNGRRVYIVDQYNEDGTFDEHKVMLGFNDEADAQDAYLSNYEKGWAFKRKLVLSSANLEDFEKWINSSHRKTKPFAEYKSVNVDATKAVSPNDRIAEIDAQMADLKKQADEAHGRSDLFEEARIISESNELFAERRRLVQEMQPSQSGEESNEQPQEQPEQIDGRYTVEQRYHKKNGTYIYAVKFTEQMPREQFLSLKKRVKDFGGYYSSYGKGGFIFDTEEGGRKFADAVLDPSGEKLDDNKPLSLADMQQGNEPVVHQVDVEGLMQAISQNGEARLSDHFVVGRPGLTEEMRTGQEEATPQSEKNDDGYGADNKLVSRERYEELKKRMRKKLRGQLNMGIDPEILAIGTEMAAYHIEAGARQFADYARHMIDDLGDAIRPYLKSFYNGARDLPEVQEAGLSNEMTPYDEVRTFDVANFDKAQGDALATAEMVVAEQEANRQADTAKEQLTNQRNEQRRKEDEQRTADTEAVADEAEAARNQAESNIEAATDEKEVNEAIRKVDEQLDKVNRQLALLGYYEAEPVESDFNEAYGYMRNAEKKAVKDANNLANRLVKDLGIDPKTIVDKKGKRRRNIATANIAPIGGDISIHLPLGEKRELYINIQLDKQDGDNLKSRGGYIRIENPNPERGEERYLSTNDFFNENEAYQSLLGTAQRLVNHYAPDFVPLSNTQQEASTKSDKMQGKRQKKQEQPVIADLFSGQQEEASPKIQEVKSADTSTYNAENTEINRKFADAVKTDMLSALDSGTKPYRSILDLRKRAAGLGMEVDNDGRTDILLQELVEDGLVRAAREVAERHGNDSRETYDLICKLYEMQPTIAARSSNRIKMQQYSTPLPMAWNAARFAMTGKKDGKVLEPTAGNGMLVFAIPAGQVHANELDGTRLANLREQGFAQVTQQDATEPFEGGKQYDVVIANPPFGKREAVDYDGKLISGLDPQITLNALASMKDDGKAAIIIGGNMEYAKNGAINNMKPFFTYLYDHYNVKGVVDMDGSLYAKQGATYPTRMILIDGRRSDEERAQSAVYPPVQSKAIRKADSFEALYDIIDEVINSKDKTNGTEILRSQQGQLVPVTDQPSRNADGERHTEQPRKDDTGRLGGRTSVEGTQEPGEVVLRGEHRTDTGNGEAGRGTGGNTTGGSRGVSGTDVQRVERVGVSTERVGLDPQRTAEQPKKRGLSEEKLPYRPHNTAFSLQSVAPAAMVEAMDRTLSQIEKKHGNIDEFVRKELGYDTIDELHQALAAEQIDSVAMAIYQMKQGQALIIGDQTGVGKGRQMAALIRWAVRQGEKPIFITQKADLFSDIYRDLVDIGSGDLVPFIFNSPSAKENKGEMVDANGKVVYKGLSDAKMKKVLATGKLPDECDYAVLTYSQVNTGDEVSQKEMEEAAKKNNTRSKKSKSAKDGKATPKATFLRSIAEDNYLFLDESHTAAGSSNTGAYLQSILRSAKAATFASATFAKRPDTMPLYAIRTAMSQAKVEPDKLISIIEKGGVTLQEIMSRELTNAGQMVRRERDMSDVVTDWKTINDPETVQRARDNYDRTIAAFNAIIKFQEDYVKPMIDAMDKELAVMAESAGIKRGTDKMGVENVPFASKTYNYTKQLMLALKVDAIANEVDAEIKAGRHPVIALESTMESSIKDYSAGEVIEEPTFSASLLRGLDTVMQYTIKDENGKEQHARYSPKQLGPAGEKAYYELQDFIRESTSDIFISPLDAIIERLHEMGYKVGELTGRNLYVERDSEGRVVVKRRTDKDKKRMQREFNNGELDVLILNKSASTGISLHASEKFSDQRQRTMIIAQPLSDINDYMQMIGRIDRTGQVHRGYYINLGLPVPAENRFLMMLSTKLKSLNANTTTSQDSESNEVEAPDLLNKYGSQVVVEYLRDNPDIYDKMGRPLKKNGEKGGTVSIAELDEYKSQEDDARKITGYVALLTTQEQEEFYDDVVRRYNELIKYLNDTGNNDLKITVMPLRAKTLEKRVSSEGIDPTGTNPFAQNSYVEQVEMDVLRKPMKAAEIRKTIEQVNKGKSPEDYIRQVVATIEKEDEARIAAEQARYERSKVRAQEDIAKQTEKINRQQKRTAEEKQAAIADYVKETNENVESRHSDNLVRLNTNSDLLKQRLHMFEAGKSYLMPDNLETQMFDFYTPAIFCGYKAKDSKVTASTTLAVFATLDGRRRVEVKLSDIAALRSIYKATNDNWDAARSTTLENWDSQIPTSTRKTGYIMTGNILQAIADTQDERGGFPGQLISYTDIDGNVHDGILMPDKWNRSMLKTSGAPILSRLKQIKDYMTVTSHDGKVEITGSSWAKTYYLTIPKTKKDGAVFFENKVILRAINGSNFYPYRGKLRADIPSENIETVVRELSKQGVKVREEAKEDDALYRLDDYTTNEEEANDLFRVVDDASEIERLNNEPTIKVYRAMSLVDGKLYPPMSKKIGTGSNRISQAPSEFGQWEVSDERPELVEKDGKNKNHIYIVKDNGKGLWVAYNPYFHTSRNPLNDQFAEAYQRPNLVTVEVEVPESELSSGYQAEGAKDPVGETKWNAGPVNRQLSGDKKRKVILSRWMRPVRIVPDSEVAQRIAELIEGENVAIPDNTVTPSLLEELKKLGVKIVDGINKGRKKASAMMRGGNGALTDDDLSLANDPVSKLLGKSTRTAAQRRAFAERERGRMVERVRELAETLHLDNVDIVTDVSTLQGNRAKAKGFYSRSTGRITIVIPNQTSVFDAEQTLLHEAVAHYGLRELFGEHFDTFLDNVFQSANENVRRHIVELAEKRGWDFRTATEEYLASLAEKTDFENTNASWWSKIKELFLRMLHKIGFEDFSGVTLSDNELRYILWRSYENLAEPGRYRSILGEAEDVAKQNELKVGNYATDNGGAPRNVAERDDLYRDGDPEVHERVLARDRYEQRVRRGMYQMQEALQDSMLGLREAMEAILKGEGKKKVRIEDVDGFENAYLGENRLSSVNKAEADAFAHTLFKPLLDEVGKLAPTQEAREELTDYMMAKHGLERNRVMAERDAQKDYEATQKAHPHSKKTLQDFIDEYRQKDYAGLTALTGADNVADAESEALMMVNDYEAAHDTASLWKRTNDVSDAILSKLYETGMMSKDTYDHVRSMYEYYIPLRGFDEKTSEEAYAYLNSKNSAFNAPIKMAKGRKSKADDPFAYLQSMAESAIIQGNRNKLVKQKFLNFVLNHPSDLASVSDLWLKYDEVADEWQPVFPDNINADDTPAEVERKMQDFEDRMKELAEQEPDLYKHGKDTVNIPYRIVEQRDLRQHQVIVKRGGRDYVITINGNPRAAQALNGQTNPDNDMSGAVGAILKAGERINRELSALYTTRNPDFVVSNFIRDMLYSNSMMWIKESPNYALRFHRNFAKVNPVRMKMLLAKHRNGTLDMNNATERMFHQFMMNGGETGYANMRDIEKHKNDIRREIRKAGGRLPIRRAWDLLTERLDEVNRGVENCARFAAFMTSREMGRTIDRSIYDAKEISVNFNKKGSGAKFMGATGQTKLGNASAFLSGFGRSGFVFWNAAIQGTANFGRQAKRHPAKALTGLAVMFLLGAVVASLGYGDDDEDNENSYWNLPEYVRRSNLLFKAGDQWISIPLPVEYKAVYGLGELMVSTMSGKEHLTDGEIANAIAGQMSQLLPLDFLEGGGGMKAFIPSAVKPFAEAYGYKKSWTGLPIYKDTPFNKDMPEWTKAYKSANKYLVDLSETLNELSGGDRYTKGAIDINPAKVEYVLNGYFGGVANTIDRLTKMGETMIGQREYDPKSFLVLNRILKNGDERTEYKAVNNEYFRLKEEHDKLRTRLRNYERDTDNGVFDYAEKIDLLYNSPEYERYEIFESYRPDIDDLYNMLKEANSYGDKEEIKDIEAQLNELKKMMISDMNKTRK